MQVWGALGVILGVTVVIVSPALLVAVRINGKGREVLYLAKGDSVKLGCPYVLEPEDNGPQGVGIEWIQISPERPSPENVFLSYQDHHVNYGSSGLQDRVAFVQTDPGQRDASIRVADLQESDTGTYQCRVKKNTVAVHEVIVTVQAEKPAAPQCWSEGELTEGGSVLLRCFSRGGTAPLSYQWAKLAQGYGGGALPAGTLQGGSGGSGGTKGIWGGLREGLGVSLCSGTLQGGSGGTKGHPGHLRGFGDVSALGHPAKWVWGHRGHRRAPRAFGGVWGCLCPRAPCKVGLGAPRGTGGHRGHLGGFGGVPVLGHPAR
uniref:Ig-like domain-containing protein n=1 Tax=Geospiza parvula TaxID=87175 RepID=A0A8C3NFN3_GEOPR